MPRLLKMVAHRAIFASIILGAALAVTARAAPTRTEGDPGAGKLVFAMRCQACHAVVPGQNRLGPTMANVVGRRVGSAPGYNFSPALRDGNIVWTSGNLEQFIASPRSVFPRTKMSFAGVSNPVDRTNLIRYLASLK